MLTLDGKPVLIDTATLSKSRLTREGFLVADVLAARSGIYLYRGDEVGIPDKDMVRVYRPESTVFAKDTLRSFTSLDVTNDHPPELITAQNWRDFAVGHTGEDVARDGEYVRVSLIVRDHDTIKEIQAGKRGLSFGYTCDVEPTPGQTPDGQAYDAIQKNLIGNHLAVVASGRAGETCRIEDRKFQPTVHTPHEGAAAMPGEVTLKTVLVDGIPVQATDVSAQVIDTLQQRLKDVAAKDTAKDTKIVSLKAEIAKRDGELGTKDAEIATLKAQVTDASKIDALVSERVDVLTKAKVVGLSDRELTGKTNQELIRSAVIRRLGDQAVQGKSDDYVRCAFDFLAKGTGTAPASAAPRDHQDPLAQAFRQGGLPQFDQGSQDVVEVEHRKMVTDLESAWKTPVFNNRSQTGRAN
jgi:hypothetical protein